MDTTDTEMTLPRTIKQNGPAPAWGDLLDSLPTIIDDQTSSLKVETGRLRVWLARTGIEDGEPFARTVYVEARTPEGWWNVGYFDGDEPDPAPLGALGDAYAATLAACDITID